MSCDHYLLRMSALAFLFRWSASATVLCSDDEQSVPILAAVSDNDCVHCFVSHPEIWALLDLLYDWTSRFIDYYQNVQSIYRDLKSCISTVCALLVFRKKVSKTSETIYTPVRYHSKSRDCSWVVEQIFKSAEHNPPSGSLLQMAALEAITIVWFLVEKVFLGLKTVHPPERALLDWMHPATLYSIIQMVFCGCHLLKNWIKVLMLEYRQAVKVSTAVAQNWPDMLPRLSGCKRIVKEEGWGKFKQNIGALSKGLINGATAWLLDGQAWQVGQSSQIWLRLVAVWRNQAEKWGPVIVGFGQKFVWVKGHTASCLVRGGMTMCPVWLYALLPDLWIVLGPGDNSGDVFLFTFFSSRMRNNNCLERNPGQRACVRGMGPHLCHSLRNVCTLYGVG